MNLLFLLYKKKAWKKDLKPAGVFKYFEEICQVPRPSKKEEKIIAYLKAFGVKHNLETNVDEAGNVLIKARHSGQRKPSDCHIAIAHRHGVRKRTMMYSTTSLPTLSKQK